jgi:hypothetical protein
MGLHSAIKMLVGKLGVIKQQLDLVQQQGELLLIAVCWSALHLQENTFYLVWLC